MVPTGASAGIVAFDQGKTMSKTIRFYFDYISSNAYLAWVRLPSLAAQYGYSVEPVPVLFAGLLEAHGQLGPAEVVVKALWMGKNNLRKAALLGIPLHPPAFHPFNPLLALRVSSLPLSAKDRHAVITALFEAVWVKGLHVSEPEVIEKIGDELGLDGRILVAQARTPEIKGQLRRQTEDAIGRGVFGVPSMEVNDEVFWGYDDFPYLELNLAGKDPLDKAEWERWISSPKSSAMRRRFRSESEGV
jgi:2-hydroxychromene-2-carboxylate isomerase